MRLEQHLFLAAAPVLAAQLNARRRLGRREAGGGALVPLQRGAAPPRRAQQQPRQHHARRHTQWEGEVAGNDPRYSSFETPEAGIRAMGKNLVAYQDQHGLDTVQGIVSRWAPATENDTASYVKAVAKDVGVGAGWAA
jgi:hypothetical protein